MRSRSRGGLTAVPSSYSGTIHNWNCSTSSASHTLSFDYEVGEWEGMQDVVTKGFAKRSSRGEIIVNPMSQHSIKRDLTMGGFAYYVQKKTEACNYSQSFTQSCLALEQHGSPVGHLTMPNPRERLIKQASTRAAANIDSPTFDGTVFLGELRETIRFMRNPLTSLTRFLSDVKKVKTRKGYTNSTANFLSDNWLSYRYAVRPLVSDVENAIEAVVQTVHGHKPLYRSARGFASSTSSANDGGTYGASPGLEWTWAHNSTRTISVRAGAIYKQLRDPDTFGTNLTRIPVAGWELIPFSFVADWFVNIGPWIEAITPKIGTQLLGSWTTVNEEASSRRTIYWSFGGYTGSGSNTRLRNITDPCYTEEVLETTSKQRTPGINVGLTFNVSPLEGDIGKTRILDLVALGKQLLST